jgi:hypothetical protein
MFPPGLVPPDLDSMISMAGASSRPVEFPDCLPFLPGVSAQYGASESTTLCVWGLESASSAAPDPAGGLLTTLSAAELWTRLMTADPDRQRTVDALFTRFCIVAEDEGWSLKVRDAPAIPPGSKHATFVRGHERLEALSLGLPTGSGLYVFTFRDPAV